MSTKPVSGNPLSFSKQSRLLNPQEFEHVFKNGQKRRGPTFLLISCPNAKSYPRLGVAIAKRNVRLAHERNRVRRIIRESFRNMQCGLRKIDVIVLVNRAAQIEDNVQLRQELEKQWLSLTQ